MYLLVYVDDIILVSSSQSAADALIPCKTMIWRNRHNPLGVAYHIYIMGVLQLVQYTYAYTEAIHSLTNRNTSEADEPLLYLTTLRCSSFLPFLT
jgi:hypothetical protein